VTLRERLHAEMTDAMRAHDALRRDVLRMTQSSVYAIEKKEHRELSDDEVLAVIAREVKTRRESVEAFRAGGRPDLADKEEAEIAILAGYLPEQLTDDEISALVDAAIAATGATSPKDLGRVMGRLSAETRGRADGRRVSSLVAARLAAASGTGGARPDGAAGGA
jgi:uncharacterized protein YqeY